ncbi:MULTISPECIES: hypothetical protein [Bacillus]|uniref:hypothetical protein n=1 Tax=Bacillus TaxID=1386 RepID=UPI002243C133|nr:MULTISPECIES: hypothetical protein [Bacillus]MDN5387588.1 hypothetical protein [Bacillus sp. LB7]MEC1023403.1 hypothetical protein [Bacillus paralicheniformis]MEC1027771.1 hypothetical protein [Bacillus paralicheniformis]MEC1035355.1 hypothetical protein [Bacillus paralicheniformis]MEC1052043.1 hypothetical protein [Bacillus paralicheniformis]
MTLVTITQAEFDTLSDERLGWICVESTLLSIRGKDATAKSEAITNLNRSQRALCMFRVFYDHAKDSAQEFYSWVSYLLQAPGYWTGVTGALRYFGDENLLKLLEDTKQVIETNGYNPHAGVSAFKELERQGLLHTMNELYERFQGIVSGSLKRISSFIRSNPQDFVILAK